MAANAPIVSAGDVLQLCQQTWKLQYSFKSDRPGTPVEFADVEAELDALTKALSAISEALDEDQSLLNVSNFAAKKSAIAILESCQKTLHELEIFVASYQDVRKVIRPDGSRIIERQWRPIFIRNYLTTIWTNEGGDIHDLKHILMLHAESMVFFYEAITSGDQKLLEFILPPVAQDVEQIHAPYDGTEKAKLHEIGEDFNSLSRSMRTFSGPRPLIKHNNSNNSQFSYGANTSKKRADASREWLADPPPQVPPRSPSREVPRSVGGLDIPKPLTIGGVSPNTEELSRSISPTTTPPTTIPIRAPGSYRMRSNTGTTTSSYAQQPPSYEERNYNVVDSISHNLEKIELASNQGRSVRAISTEGSSSGSFTATVLPMSAVPLSSPHAEDPFHQIRMLGKTPPGEASSGSSTNIDTHKLWRDNLFKHSAVLFDQKCTAVEYTIPNDRRPGDFVMETACGPCSLYLITKGVKSNVGTLRYYTSIWILSDDGETVMEQKLPDDADVIPYTIWDNHTKIVLRLPADLRFYGKHPDDRAQRTATTQWVNYVFAEETSATEFQNVLLGKKLLVSIRTRKTTRIHSGMTGAFQNQQQLCALENLRIVRDDNTGLIYGMIHFVPEFSTGNGYMTFALNDTKHPIRVKEDSATAIKIKGMTMNIREGTRRPSTSSDPTRASKKGQDVLITGAKLEFYNRDDKALFMLKLKEIQDSGHLVGD